MIRAFIFVLLAAFASTALAFDTDGDGLLDVLDVPEFGLRRQSYRSLGIEDLDGANLLNREEWLDFDGNFITGIESGDFAGLSNLGRLHLTNNQITSIESGDFDGLIHVEDLYLYGNEITSIESGDFDGIGWLETLGLSRNRITSIESGDFDGIDSLETLNVRSNQITNIESGAFDSLGRLSKLRLGDNRITNIESGGFRGLNNLETLDLDGNELTVIRSGDFGELNNLRALDLHGNQLASIESGCFHGLDGLETLDLDGNQLGTIGSGDLAGLSSLQGLFLRNNRVANIESGGFAGLGSLGTLDLGGNQITIIEKGDFAGLNELETLRLDNNPISMIEDEAFAGLDLNTLIVASVSALNLTGAEFERLYPCVDREGFCANPNTLVLDRVKIDRNSLEIIVSQMSSTASVSIVGLEEFDGGIFDSPSIVNLLRSPELRHVTVDTNLYLLHQDGFDAFDAVEGKTVDVVIQGLGERFECNFNNDTVCDGNDLDMLMSSGAIDQGVPVGASENDVFDFDGGGVIDRVDLLTWLGIAADKNGLAQPYEIGDANLDGRVDASDLNAVGVSWLTEGNVWTSGDFDGDGYVGIGDLNVLGIAWNSSVEVAETTAVPEPCFGLVYLLVILFGAAQRISTN